MERAPIDVRPLFRPLQEKLIELLSSLSSDDWNRQTVARQWKVKDAVSHLLDGDLRVLSMQRDKYFGEKPPKISGYKELVDWLNQLNADWVMASRRLSPDVLRMLHQTTGPQVCDYYESLVLEDKAIFSVDWAGESASLNWMHLAREYTEKWHHQQQIRDAVGMEGIMTQRFFYPCMDTFFRALPHTFRDTEAEFGTVVQTTISAEAGGSWYLIKREKGWSLTLDSEKTPAVIVEIPAEISWKLFSKSLRPSEIREQVKITGNQELGERVLEMVAVMA